MLLLQLLTGKHMTNLKQTAYVQDSAINHVCELF